MNLIQSTVAVLFSAFISSSAFAIDICTQPNTQIPDNGTEVAIPIFYIADDNEVVDSIEVDLTMTHDWVGDLLIKLRAPDGTTITLLDRPGIPSAGFPGPFGCGGRDISCSFTDSASIPAESVCSTTQTPVISGLVIPSMPMETFLGQPAAGFWQLLVSDHSAHDTGVVLEACLSIETTAVCIADLNDDGELDFIDISTFVSAFGNADPIADLNNDGQHDFIDISAFVAAFTAGCP